MSHKISPNGKKIMVIKKDGFPVIYDVFGNVVKTLSELDEFYTNTTIKEPCWISEDLVCCGSDDHGLYIWSLKNGRNGASYVKYFHRSLINSVCYSAKHDTLFSAGVEKYITAWKRSKFMGSDDTERKRQIYSPFEIDSIMSTENDGEYHGLTDDYREDDVRCLAMFDFACRHSYDAYPYNIF